VIEGTGERFRCHLISTLTNRGTLRFQVFQSRFTTEVFLEFLHRLVRSTNNKIFLIVDRHPVHRANCHFVKLYSLAQIIASLREVADILG